MYVHLEILESESSNSFIYVEEFVDNIFRNIDECEQPLLMSQENVESCKNDVDIRDQNQEKIVSKFIFTLVTVLEERPLSVLPEDCELILFLLKIT